MTELRHDCTRRAILDAFGLPFTHLNFQAQAVHRRHWDPNPGPLSPPCAITAGRRVAERRCTVRHL